MIICLKSFSSKFYNTLGVVVVKVVFLKKIMIKPTTSDHPQNLPKLGHSSERKAEKFKESHYVLATCLNLLSVYYDFRISSSKSGDFGTFLFTKFL